MRLGDPDDSGRRAPVPIDGADSEWPADSVILAISQAPALEGLEALVAEGSWLSADQAGVVADDIIAGGDALGLGIAGNAIVQGRRAAEALHARLSGSAGEPPPTADRERIRHDRLRLESLEPSGRARPTTLEPADRVAAGMAEAVSTLDEPRFLAEVERCYSCGSCFGCEQCFMYCTSGCFTRLEEPRPGMYFALNLDACKECGKCVEVCPCGFLEAE
jgi:Pyruvate/2-oxoacid:ferredoxin oxidoreductase delta subunit